MKIRTRIAALAGACGLALTLLAPAAQAQNALGDGRALDRNLQPGSGGVNTRVRDIDAQIRFSNAIVTGNAPGLASFRGDVGYLAPGDFRGRLGSNDLFPFIRDAAPPAYAAQTGIRGTDALRYQFGLTTTTPGIAPSPLGFRGPVAFERAGSGASGAELASGLRSTSDFLTRQSLRPVVIGLGSTTADAQIDAAVAASPLIGVRTLRLPAPGDITPVIERPIVEPLIPGQVPEIETAPGLDPQETGVTDGLGLRETTRAPGEPDPAAFSGLGTPPERTAMRQRRLSALTGLEPFARGVTRPDQQPPTRVDLAATPTALEPRTIVHLSSVERLRQELDATLAAAQQRPTRETPGAEGETAVAATPLEQRLEDLRRRLAGEPPIERPDQTRPADPQRPERPGLGEPEELTPEEEEAREQERRDAMRHAGLRLPGRVEFDPNTVDALRRSRSTIRDLSTPSVADNMVYAENMAAGQTLLAQGRYFDAEERFVRAAAAIPGEPMASVGRIHAQIGAGLFMSASMNLRTLLTTNPELLPARYGESLLPSRSRWAAIRDQLTARLEGDDRGAARASALLLAYLGYQFGDEVALRQGIETLRSGPEMQVDSEAALVSLLEAVWLDTPADAPADGE